MGAAKDSKGLAVGVRGLLRYGHYSRFGLNTALPAAHSCIVRVDVWEFEVEATNNSYFEPFEDVLGPNEPKV